MTVICRVLGARNMIVFSKGAPEKIMCLCDPKTSKYSEENFLCKYSNKFQYYELHILWCGTYPVLRVYTWLHRILTTDVLFYFTL